MEKGTRSHYPRDGDRWLARVSSATRAIVTFMRRCGSQGIGRLAILMGNPAALAAPMTRMNLQAIAITSISGPIARR